MELKSAYDLGVVADLAEKREAAQAAELEAYWNEIVSSGDRFDPDRAIALLLFNVKRYEAAILRIAEIAKEQKALMEHRYRTGQEVSDVDLARYASYLKTAHIATDALAQPASSSRH
jgi:hypothetical protein